MPRRGGSQAYAPPRMTPSEVARRLQNGDWFLRGYFVVGTVAIAVLILAVILGLPGAVPPDVAVLLWAAGLSGPVLRIAEWRGRRRLEQLKREVDANPGHAQDLMSSWIGPESFRSWLPFGLVVGPLLAIATVLFVIALPGR